MNIFKLFPKSISMRIVNILGLSVVFTCLVLSSAYIKQELSYDRHHANANRIVRMSLQFDNQPVDGRIAGGNAPVIHDLLQQIPEIERMVKMFRVYSAELKYREKLQVVNDLYLVNREFLHVFDIPLLCGNMEDALQREGQVLISETLAQQLFGELNWEEILTSEISMDGRQFGGTVIVSGIFQDIPETSHFKTDILLHLLDDNDSYYYIYIYLLLKNQTDIDTLAQKITELVHEAALYQPQEVRALLMPLSDIHLLSRNLREMGVNGNINYIYLVIGANALLLIVVFFNLWLNTTLIFARNRRFYQIMRLHGAPLSSVIKDEAFMALLSGIISIITGLLAAFSLSSSPYFSLPIPFIETAIVCVLFLLSIMAISLLPTFKSLSCTLFLHIEDDIKPVRFSCTNVKYMLVAQYAVVMMVVILAFGINKQMNLVKQMQVGGNERNILVMNEQPDQVQANYILLKSELLKHPEIEFVTSCFQLPGDAIRDATSVKKEGDTAWSTLPIMVAGEEFLSLFRIGLIAGKGFSPGKYDYKSEETMLFERLSPSLQKYSEHEEEYILNKKALPILGFASPEEAVGQILQLEHSAIDYIRRGVIVGVTDDFNYTGLYEETIPLLILQRSYFLHHIMVRFVPYHFTQAKAIFEEVWKEVNPDYPANYIFMNDLFGRIYRNEVNAQRLVTMFSLLCFAVADLGLIIFMAFIIRRRTREIGIRKVHGATVGQIVQMLNVNSIRHIVWAFAIAVFASWYIMHRWLEQFAIRIPLNGWVFVLAGLTVLSLSVLSVSVQSWRAATANPVDAIKSE